MQNQRPRIHTFILLPQVLAAWHHRFVLPYRIALKCGLSLGAHRSGLSRHSCSPGFDRRLKGRITLEFRHAP
jgi:hypothetical protein